MAKYIVRIELHGAGTNSEPYQRLHEEMSDIGFERFIHPAGNVHEQYVLPSAEYFSDINTLPVDKIFEQIKAIATKINPDKRFKPYVLLSALADVRWSLYEASDPELHQLIAMKGNKSAL
ncbi:hypothetical protein NUR12_001063 [Salmonella enterica]|nr:hypothetical protein [Salmonella enterica]